MGDHTESVRVEYDPTVISYEALLQLTRTNREIDQETIADFISGLDVSPSVKEELLRITPENYTGIDCY